MKLSFKIAAISFAFIAISGISFLNAQTPDQWPEEYIGTWKLTNDKGEINYINLYNSKKATNTFDRRANGTWLYHPDEAEIRMEWSNEWADVMVKQGDGFKDFGYAPGSNPDSKPAEEWNAEKVGINPFDYLGVWEGLDVKGRSYKFTIKIDDTAIYDSKGNEKGNWSIIGDRIQISWPDGVATLFKDGNKYKAYLYEGAKTTDGKPTAVADMKRVIASLRSDPRAQEFNEEGEPVA